MFRIDVEIGEVERRPAGLRVVRIEVHDDQHRVVARRVDLGVADQFVVIDGNEAQAVVALQRRIVAPRGVHAGDERGEVVGAR